MVALGRGGVSYERSTPVFARQRSQELLHSAQWSTAERHRLALSHTLGSDQNDQTISPIPRVWCKFVNLWSENDQSIVSHIIYSLVSFRKPAPPQNRQIIVLKYYLKYKVDSFVQELTF